MTHPLSRRWFFRYHARTRRQRIARMISYRGLLAVAAGVLFLALAFRPTRFGDDVPPVFIAAVLVVAGLGLVAMGVLSLRFVFRRAMSLRDVAPVQAEIIIQPNEDCDSAVYTLDVRLAGTRWSVGAAGNKAIYLHETGVAHRAEVWPDAKTGAPVAIAINGLQVNTLPTPRRWPE
jgi:signal transduction histidine kinase